MLPTYALHGPYWVGTQTWEMDAGTEDAIRYTIWYPALNPDGLPEATTYTMSDNHGLRTDYGFSPDEPFTVIGHALEGAAPDLSGAPYPLVINSHAFTAQMWQIISGSIWPRMASWSLRPSTPTTRGITVYTDTVTRMLEITRRLTTPTP